MQPLQWNGKSLLVLDQTLLPEQEVWDDCDTYELVAEAIEKMKVRGAPAIGATAAYGIAIGANAPDALALDKGPYLAYLEAVNERLAKTRPTAVNLFWAIKRMRGLIAANTDLSVAELGELITREANLIAEEDVRLNKRIGQNGLQFIPENARILTHCNTGSLATFDYGTALGVIRAAHEQGRVQHVYADETRPYLQGARLTAFELHRDNIPVTVVTDSMAGYLMQQKMVDLVIVGADRIAANGDAANKIGTYSLAVLAKHHGIPFYVAAPMSTLDYEMETGDEIEIEQRSADEVIFIGGKRMVPEGVPALHPAFDVTPHELITAIITDQGNAWQPNTEAMLKLK